MLIDEYLMAMDILDFDTISIRDFIAWVAKNHTIELDSTDLELSPLEEFECPICGEDLTVPDAYPYTDGGYPQNFCLTCPKCTAEMTYSYDYSNE